MSIQAVRWELEQALNYRSRGGNILIIAEDTWAESFNK
jgi:hypothetical protein